MPVVDGINAFRALIPRIWFDREKCNKGTEALKQYRTEYDDKKGIFRNTPLHDWCVTGDTLVATTEGDIQMLDIAVGHRVLLGEEDAMVIAKFNNGVKHTLKLNFDDGSHLTCTDDHLIFTTKGLVRADTISYSDYVLTSDSEVSSWLENPSGLKAAFIESTTGINSGSGRSVNYTAPKKERRSDYFIDSCGKIVTDLSQQATKSFRAMAIGMTSRKITGFASPTGSEITPIASTQRLCTETGPTTWTQEPGTTTTQCTRQGRSAFFTGIFGKMLTGLFRQRTTSITSTTIKKTTTQQTSSCYPEVTTKSTTAKQTAGLGAEKTLLSSMLQDTKPPSGTGLRLAGSGIRRTVGALGILASTMKRLVRSVVRFTQPDTLDPQSTAIRTAKRLLSVEDVGYQSVYDITVEKHHAFYANGTLISNCSDYADAARYFAVTPLRGSMSRRASRPSKRASARAA
jgi:hypothetical protein